MWNTHISYEVEKPALNSKVPELHVFRNKEQIIENTPIILYLHHGGWAIGDAKDDFALRMAIETKSTVISPQ